MKVIAYDQMKSGVTYQKIEPYLPQEVANVWRLWKAGIVRENYARADELGVVIVFVSAMALGRFTVVSVRVPDIPSQRLPEPQTEPVPAGRLSAQSILPKRVWPRKATDSAGAQR